MNYKKPETDSGSYVNGVYTSKNGFAGSGLNCPKGTRLYNTDVICPIFFMPEDRGPNEDFEMVTQEVCPDIMPYYAISNYGRLMNVNSGKIMKPNYRPNGYEYYCLAAEGNQYGQKKYSTSRMVMKTFDPREDADDLEVNHINGDKTQNYYQKQMEDGSIQSNLEWATKSENIQHAHDTGLHKGEVLDFRQAREIRRLRNQGYSYAKIQETCEPKVSVNAIQMVCKNLTFHDPNYRPTNQSMYDNVEHNKLKLSDADAGFIRKLASNGFKYKDIQEKFYPHVSIGTISDVVRGVTHNCQRNY